MEPAADPFSVAATLDTLLTGQFIRDLSGPLSARIEQILNSAALPIRQRRLDLPEKLAGVIHRALQRDPRRRYSSVTHFRQALRPFATGTRPDRSGTIGAFDSLLPKRPIGITPAQATSFRWGLVRGTE